MERFTKIKGSIHPEDTAILSMKPDKNSKMYTAEADRTTKEKRKSRLLARNETGAITTDPADGKNNKVVNTDFTHMNSTT